MCKSMYEIKQLSHIILFVKFFNKINFKCKKIKDLIKDSIMINQIN